jgi:hypothetical protein
MLSSLSSTMRTVFGTARVLNVCTAWVLIILPLSLCRRSVTVRFKPSLLIIRKQGHSICRNRQDTLHVNKIPAA